MEQITDHIKAWHNVVAQCVSEARDNSTEFQAATAQVLKESFDVKSRDRQGVPQLVKLVKPFLIDSTYSRSKMEIKRDPENPRFKLAEAIDLEDGRASSVLSVLEDEISKTGSESLISIKTQIEALFEQLPIEAKDILERQGISIPASSTEALDEAVSSEATLFEPVPA